MRMLSRWCRWKSAAFMATLATLAAALALVTGVSIALAGATPGSASAPGSAAAVDAATTTSGIAPAMTCSGVTSLDLAAAVPGVPFEAGSATEVAVGSNTLGNWGYCDVQGVIAPQIHFELRLPDTGWQADYLQLGCGGLCGSVNTGNAAASYGCVPLTDGAFDSPQLALTYRDIKFTASYYKKVMEPNAGIYDATDPDLTAFKKAGGKLILWHGLGDQHIPAVGTMAYYKAVEKAMGGEAATTGFARLFLLPGVAHCGGGQGPDRLDALTAITDWVTQGKVPAGLLTSTVDSAGKVTSSRPAYPFPAIAENTTGGSSDDPSSYTSVKSTAEANLTLNWLGSFRSGYEQVGNRIHGKWVISKGKA
ncbi:tannase/feruloyl esterase family alpha/beta hydrolase [Streptomyces sp. NPDC048291]|uniref:tannase/feruloyl esterase family alpha/beta hydrolase n=1 Tax=Streptomyces sp. NPDC048291 TaxID=3365530 RepID=UPI0037168AA5